MPGPDRATKTPADTEDRTSVDVRLCRKVKHAAPDRAITPQHQLTADECHNYGAPHDEGERRIPCAEETEEVEDFGRNKGARDHKTETEKAGRARD
jgi:hypothetical protein